MTHLRQFVTILTLFAAMLTSQVSYAWGGVGHRLVGQIALDNLKPCVRSRVLKMSSDLNESFPRTRGFVNACVLPDFMKGRDVTAFNRWHYIDIPYRHGMSRIPRISKRDNALFAIKQSRKVLASSRANRFEQAFFMSMLCHVVADIHQPLHAISLHSAAFPHGDMGGGKYLVMHDKKTLSLHRLWDEGLYFYRKVTDKRMRSRVRKQLARDLQVRYPKSYFAKQLRIRDTRDMVVESYKIARDFVYTTPQGRPVSDEYLKAGQKIAQQRIVLAGYRLAKILNNTVACRSRPRVTAVQEQAAR